MWYKPFIVVGLLSLLTGCLGFSSQYDKVDSKHYWKGADGTVYRYTLYGHWEKCTDKCLTEYKFDAGKVE